MFFRKNIGFTLIELLVTTVIVGVLATISISAYNNMIKRAVDAKKKAVVKEIAKMVYMARNEDFGDNNSTIYGHETGYAIGPPGRYCNSSDVDRQKWCPYKILETFKYNIPDFGEQCLVYGYFSEGGSVLEGKDFFIAIPSSLNPDEIFFDGSPGGREAIENNIPHRDGWHWPKIPSPGRIKDFIRHFGNNGTTYYGTKKDFCTTNYFAPRLEVDQDADNDGDYDRWYFLPFTHYTTAPE